METDLSKSSADQLLFLINESITAPDLTFSDITLGTPTVGVAKNTALVVSAVPNSGYSGSVEVQYDRLSLDGFEQYGPAEVIIPVNGTFDDVLDAFNALYGANLDYSDIPTGIDVSSANYAGVPFTINALTTSYAFQGSIDVVVRWPGVQLNTIIVDTHYTGLDFPPLPQFLTFNQPSNYDFDDTAPVLTVTSSAALPVSFSSTTPTVCGVDGSGNVSFLLAGTCSIQASQPGDDHYSPADPVIKSFTINPVPPGVPSILNGNGGYRQAALRATPPAFKGGVTNLTYTAISTPGNITATSTSLPIVVPGLADDTSYTFEIKAGNVAGDSVYSVGSASLTTLKNDFYPPYTWTALPMGLGGISSTSTYLKLVTDGKGVWLAGGLLGHAARSIDNGNTWTALPTGLSGPANGINCFATDGKGTWISGNSSGYASRSTDNGETWTPLLPRCLNSGSTNGSMNSVCTDGNGMWLAGFNAGYVAKSVDDGLTWTAFTRGLNSGIVTGASIAITKDATGVWIAVGSGGWCSRSTDNGVTWTALPRWLNSGSAGDDGTVATTDGNGMWIVGFNNGYLSKSTDNGVTWVGLPRNGGMTGIGANFQAIVTDKKGRWFGMLSNKNILSVDNGVTWSSIASGYNTGASASNPFSAAETDGHGRWIVTGSNGYCAKGEPNFNISLPKTWTTITPANLNSGATNNWINGVATDTNGVMVAVFELGWAARSIDNGLTWSALTRGLGYTDTTINYQAIATNKTGIWIAVGYYGVAARSTDNGATWTKIAPTGLNSGNPTVIFRGLATDCAGVWITAGDSGWAARSTDNGVTWAPLTQGLNCGLPSAVFNGIATDRAGVWVAVGSAGYAARSTDNGATWTALPKGLNSGATTDAILSVATDRAGVWVAGFGNGFCARSTDNGVTWTALPQGGGTAFAAASLAFVGTDCKGYWIFTSIDGNPSFSSDNGAKWSMLPKGIYTGSLTPRLTAATTDEKGVWVVNGNLGSSRATS